MSRRSAQRKVSVNLCPPELNFVLEDENSHRKRLTLFNPCREPMLYHIYTLSPSKFAVEDKCFPLVDPRSSAQVYIKYTNPSAEDCQNKHLFVVALSDITTKKTVGENFVLGKVRSRNDKPVRKVKKQEQEVCSDYESPEDSENEITIGEPRPKEEPVKPKEKTKAENPGKTRDQDSKPTHKKICRPVPWKLDLFLWSVVMLLLAISYFLSHQLAEETGLPEWVHANAKWEVRLAGCVGFFFAFLMRHTAITMKQWLKNLFS